MTDNHPYVWIDPFEEIAKARAATRRESARANQAEDRAARPYKMAGHEAFIAEVKMAARQAAIMWSRQYGERAHHVIERMMISDAERSTPDLTASISPTERRTRMHFSIESQHVVYDIAERKA